MGGVYGYRWTEDVVSEDVVSKGVHVRVVTPSWVVGVDWLPFDAVSKSKSNGNLWRPCGWGDGNHWLTVIGPSRPASCTGPSGPETTLWKEKPFDAPTLSTLTPHPPFPPLPLLKPSHPAYPALYAHHGSFRRQAAN
ncbi:hypothetical protein BC936DRAFT_145840 [Jimgerdemannia flammicorona]|uniref:Uncharacterized protein n=1 Tax=Jimgerdemannia flammicorona TaxID=994334 RepID=A0A433D9N8_9FUNG|nr:hypothetical protein BC936DRAFT_145840 [Jimgerdemannia flammicorona]